MLSLQNLNRVALRTDSQNVVAPLRQMVEDSATVIVEKDDSQVELMGFAYD